jgi:hypothetical protein
MIREHADQQMEIKAQGLMTIRDQEGSEVFCLEGVVWITQTDDCRDIVVYAGESFTLDRPGVALVEAPAGPATIALRAATFDRARQMQGSAATSERLAA